MLYEQVRAQVELKSTIKETVHLLFTIAVQSSSDLVSMKATVL